MVFRVEVMPRALQDLDEAASYLCREDSPQQAGQWLDQILIALRSLERFPMRCAVATEAASLDREVRMYLHVWHKQPYRIYYAVDLESKLVQVLHVRHGSRSTPQAADLDAEN
jgi:plasmid stabilization system protein ParE